MFDVDKFIELLQNQPSLWDKSCGGYSNRVIRDKSWLAVAQELFPDWDGAEVKEKDRRGKEMRKKWKHIRDEYHRQLNKSKSGDPRPSKKKKTYVWAEALNFLQNSITKRNTSGNLEEDEFDKESGDNVDDVESQEDQQNMETLRDVVRTPTGKALKFNLDDKSRRNTKLSTFQSQLLKKLDTGTTSENDSDLCLTVAVVFATRLQRLR